MEYNFIKNLASPDITWTFLSCHLDTNPWFSVRKSFLKLEKSWLCREQRKKLVLGCLITRFLVISFSILQAVIASAISEDIGPHWVSLSKCVKKLKRARFSSLLFYLIHMPSQLLPSTFRSLYFSNHCQIVRFFFAHYITKTLSAFLVWSARCSSFQSIPSKHFIFRRMFTNMQEKLFIQSGSFFFLQSNFSFKNKSAVELGQKFLKQ